MHMHSLVKTVRPAMSKSPDLRGDAHAGMDRKRRAYLEPVVQEVDRMPRLKQGGASHSTFRFI
jgi:hypothetical protein